MATPCVETWRWSGKKFREQDLEASSPALGLAASTDLAVVVSLLITLSAFFLGSVVSKLYDPDMCVFLKEYILLIIYVALKELGTETNSWIWCLRSWHVRGVKRAPFSLGQLWPEIKIPTLASFNLVELRVGWWTYRDQSGPQSCLLLVPSVLSTVLKKGALSTGSYSTTR